MSELKRDPRKLDLATLAREHGALEGTWPQAALTRLQEGSEYDQSETPCPPVTWRAQGALRTPVGGAPQVWLALQAQAQVQRQCQRCLLPVTLDVAVDRQFRLVADADQAARLDAELDDDVLELKPRFDLIELIEDELLLALPIIARHENCQHPAISTTFEASHGDLNPAEPEDHPFAVLARLKRDNPEGSR